MTDDLLRGAGYHEAGHAVAALALGLRVARVEIVHEDYSGAADVHVADVARLPLVDQITIYSAGMIANQMFEAPNHELAASQDLRRIEELISDMDEAEGEVLQDDGEQRACDLLKAHADSVHDIAAQLLAHRKINLTGYVLKHA